MDLEGLVGYNFRTADRDQVLLLPVSLTEWLDENHLAWFVCDAVERMDLSTFYAGYRADGWGRAAHQPSMMVALMLYAHCIGVRSSRAIEKASGTDVAFRVITANQVPDHTTIARFRSRHHEALAAVFVASLRLCAQAGLVNVGRVAVDATLIGCPTALESNRTREHIDAEVAKMLAEADEADAAEDALFGAEATGTEPPAQLRGATARRARFAQPKPLLMVLMSRSKRSIATSWGPGRGRRRPVGRRRGAANPSRHHQRRRPWPTSPTPTVGS